MINLARVASIAADEAIRQKVGIEGFANLLKAYELASHMAAYGPSSEAQMLAVAARVNGRDMIEYRRTPVTFPNMTIAPHYSVIPNGMRRAFVLCPYVVWNCQGESDVKNSSVEEWVKNFLDIHPFIDGNGRTAWILRTWLLDQWEYPHPLPDYYDKVS